HVVVKTYYPRMVERNPGVVRIAACVRDRRKHIRWAEDWRWIGWRDLIDQLAMCDKNVARGEPGIRGHQWSDSQIHFFAPGSGRDRRQKCGSPVAGDAIDLSQGDASGGAVVARVQISRRSGLAYGPALTLRIEVRAKEMDAGVKDTSHRWKRCNCQSDRCFSFHFFGFLGVG